jgi:hypothetical protein
MSLASPNPTKQFVNSDSQRNDGTQQQWNETELPPVDYASLAAEYVPGSDAEKKLLRKIDFRVIVRIPFLGKYAPY